MLSVELIQRIFPVAPSDRRINKDIFQPFLNDHDLRDDARFYAKLSELILEPGAVTLQKYDERMRRNRKVKKEFTYRALKFLQCSPHNTREVHELLGCKDEVFDPGTPEALILEFVRRIGRVRRFDEVEVPGEDSGDSQPSEDWAAIARTISTRLSEMSRPDPAIAEEILQLADSLFEACHEATRVAICAASRKEVMDGLAALDGDLVSHLPESIESSLFEALKAAIGAAQESQATYKAAAAQAVKLKALHDAASEREDYDEVWRLTALRRDAFESRLKSGTEFSSSLAGLRQLLGLDANGGTAAGSSPEAPKGEAGQLPTDHGPTVVVPSEDRSSATLDAEVVEGRHDAVPDVDAADAECLESTLEVAVTEPESLAAVVTDSKESANKNAPYAAEPAREVPEPTEVRTRPPETSGGTNLSANAALALHLSQGDDALAWHLARLIEKSARTPPIPSTILAALVVAPNIHGPDDMADAFHVEVLAEMMAALRPAHVSEGATLLALSSLIRPALFGPDSGARDHVGSLPRDGEMASCIELIDALATLGYQVRISADDLADLAGHQRQQRIPAATRMLSEWLNHTRHRKTTHQPTYRILHWALAPEGEIGGVFESAITNLPGAGSRAESLLLRLSDQEARETFISECERLVGRPARDRIEGTARGWFTSRLEEAAEHLKNWLDARQADRRRGPAGDRVALESALGALRKVAIATRESLAGALRHSDMFTQACRDRLLSAVDDLRMLIEGRSRQCTARLTRAEMFDVPLLRLPSGCQDWTDGDPTLEEERDAVAERLLWELSRPEAVAPDDASAFHRHLQSRAVLPAKALLDRLRLLGQGDGAVRALEQELEEARMAGRREALYRIGALQQGLTTLAYLDIDAAEKQRGTIAQLAGIAEALSASGGKGLVTLPAEGGIRKLAVPPDFPELYELLSSLEAKRDSLRARIRESQSSALNSLVNDPQVGASARELAEAVDRLDPVVVDDALADLRSGRAFSLKTDEHADGFYRFFPNFVSEVDAEGTRLTRGRAIDAAASARREGPLDFAPLDAVTRHRARLMIEAWGEVENALRRNEPRPLRDALIRLFGLFELTSVKLDNDRELIPNKLRSLNLSSDPWRSKRWFIPPAFGSSARGHYPLLIARDLVSLSQIEAQLSEMGRDRPCLVFFCTRLTVSARRELAHLLRRERQQALVLDETLLLHIATERALPLETLLSASLPFGWLQPYDTSAGRAAPEMFVGRQEEIRAITAQAAGGSLIYGGRQLGKSALLDRIRQESHRPEDGKLAYLLEIKPIGGPGRPASDLWGEFGNCLRQERTFAGIGASPESIVGTLRTWLSERPDRRIIAMFDEADNFLRAEHAADYPNLTYLKQLMQDTGWQFKAVFAGLHNVRRMARAPNSPLPHLGEPVCVGPMNSTPENRSALRRLATEPLRAAGFDYEEPALVGEMLARVNYYPSLVQVFGQRVIESMGRRPENPAKGPRWPLGRSVLFEGEAAKRIAEDIRNRFQLTLNLDLRYDLIAKTLAFRRLDSAGGERQVLSEGMTVGQIQELVIPWWPSSLPRPTREDLAELLSEVVDLGVLARYPGDRFGLRNAQVAQMLGDRDRLETDILNLSEHDEAIDYDASMFYRSLAPGLPSERAPLSDRDVDALFDRSKPGLRAVIGSTAVTGDRLAVRLDVLARQWNAGIRVESVTRRGAIREGLDRLGAVGGVLMLELPWDEAAADRLSRQTAVMTGQVLPVWVLPNEKPPILSSVRVFRAGAWSELMLRHWLLEEGLLGYDERGIRRAVMKATGMAPARLVSVKPLLTKHAADPVAQRLKAIESWGQEHKFDVNAVGLDPAHVDALKTLVSADDDTMFTANEIDSVWSGATQALLDLELAGWVGKEELVATTLGCLVEKSLE